MSQTLEGLTREELISRLNSLENKQVSGGIKISQKGAISLYGIGRFPVTLYSSQWIKVAQEMPAILEFLKTHAGQYSVKGAKEELAEMAEVAA